MNEVRVAWNDTESPVLYVKEQRADSWIGIAKIAERLGVKEGDSGVAEAYIALQDGRKYSICALVNALLDRIDQSLGAPK